MVLRAMLSKPFFYIPASLHCRKVFIKFYFAFTAFTLLYEEWIGTPASLFPTARTL